MTTVESLLSWDTQKLNQLAGESGDVARVINVFREFLSTVADERQRFAEERTVLAQQAKVTDLNAEQRCVEMQNQIYELSNKLNTEAQSRESLLAGRRNYETEISQLKKQVDSVRAEKGEVTLSLTTLESDSNELKLKLEDALRRLHYKEEEMKRLNSEWEEVSEKESELSKLQAETRAKLSDVESREISLKYREERLEQEKNIFTQQNTWLTDELAAKTDELSKLRQSSTEIACKLKSELAEKSEEAAFLNASHKTLKDHSTKMDKRVGELVTKLQDKDSSHLAELENIRLHLNKQERLTELYNNNCDEYQGKIKDLTTAVTEMQAMLTKAQEENLQLEQQSSDEIAKHVAAIKELEGKISKMQNELDNANDLIMSTRKTEGSSSLDVSQLSSTAVTVGGLLKSGMTILQIYSSYVEATEQLALEKDKNRLQSQYLDQILKEIEEKAPLLQQQRTDYENALLNQDNLADKLETSMKQVESYRIACEENQNTSRSLKRENERHKTQIKDLSQQVQVLLKEVEDARAGRVSRHAPPSPSLNSSRGSNSSQVISDNLVSFRSVTELQQQNQKLLCVVRELSEEQERREVEDEDPKIVELRAKLEGAADQIRELKEAQGRQVEMVEAVARQRDMYRVLLAQAGHKMDNAEEPKDKGKKSAESSESVSKHELALAELQKEFTAYKTEKRDQIALVQEQLDTARCEHSSMLTEKTQLTSKLEFAQEKYKLLENSQTNNAAEVKQFRDKCTELTTSVTRLQLTNDRLQNEVLSSREEVNKLRHQLEGQRKTIELLRVTEIKQRTQNEALIRESRTQNMLLSNLQTIQNNLERQEFEKKERTDKKLSLLQSELSEARRKLTSTELRYKTAEAIQNSQNNELKSAVEKERASLRERQEMLDKLQTAHNALLTECGELRARVSSLNTELGGETHVSQTVSQDQETEETITVQAARLKEQAAKITELQHKIIELTAREESVQSQVVLAKQHAQQYKEISEAHEMALKELTQSEQSVKCASEQLISQNWEEISTLTEKLNSANSALQSLQSELEEYQSKGADQLKELSFALTKTQHKLEEARQKEESAISLEQEIRAQYNKLNTLYDESQTSISEQKDRIATLEEKVTELAQKSVQYQEQVAGLVSAKNTAELKLEEGSKVWHTEKIALQQDRDSLRERTQDLDQQNVLLHSQLASLSKDIVELQKALATEQPMKESSDVTDDKSTEELWEIIRFVRREKDILSTKVDVADSEATRYKNRCSFLEKQVEETRKSLEEERQNSSSSIMSLENHQEMLKKVEETQAMTQKINQLTESVTKLTSLNTLLKQQISVTEKQTKTMKTTARELTDKVNVLQAEKEGLTKDVKRWSDRCNELIEQCNKVDVKEFSRLQTETAKLKAQLKKKQEDHSVELAAVQEKQAKSEEEGGRIAEEKRQLLGTINSMKADGTKLRMELNNVSAELKTANTQLTAHKTEVEKLKTVETELRKEMADTKDLMEKQMALDMAENQSKISKLQAIAKKYRAIAKESEAAAATGSSDSTKEKDLEEKLRKAMEGCKVARTKIAEVTTKNKELEQELGESNSSVEVLKTALESQKTELDEKLVCITASHTDLQGRMEKADSEITNLRNIVQTRENEITRLSEQLSARQTRSVETNTDMATLDQTTNTEDTPTASVKPTASASVKPTASHSQNITTPTAAVRPTSIAPDITPRMAAVTPTTSVHIPTSSSSAAVILPNVSTVTTAQVSSSSVQGQGEPSSRADQEVTTGEVRAMVRSSPRVSSRGDEPVSSAGFKRSRCDVEDDDGEQPGPSTKIAMVTSSAHVHHTMEHAPQTSSEVSQSTQGEVLSSVSQSTSSVGPCSSAGPSNKQPASKQHVSLVSSSERSVSELGVASSSFDSLLFDSADVSSSQAGAPVDRDMVGETNEATPATTMTETMVVTEDEEEEEDILMNEDVVTSQGHVTTLRQGGGQLPTQSREVIDIGSDSDECSDETSNHEDDDDEDNEEEEEEEEDVYSGLEEVEEDSKQLQFSYVQSSGTDPVMDVLPDSDDHESLLEDTGSAEVAETGATSSTVSTTSNTVRSLRTTETPWAHLATSSSPASDTTSQPSSSSNVRSIRRIKRLPPKKE